MKKLTLFLILTCPFLINAQVVKGWRIQPIFFAPNAIMNKRNAPIQDEFTHFVPKFSYGLVGQAIFGIISKIDFITGLGFDARNFITNSTGLYRTDPQTGDLIESIAIIETKNLISLFIPLKFAYNFNQNNAFEFGLNAHYRILGECESNLFTPSSVNTSRIELGSVPQNFKKININAQIEYCYKKNLNTKFILLIKPYTNLFLSHDDFYVNVANNRFWDAGLSIGLEFGKANDKN